VSQSFVKGKTIDEALMITNKDISDALGGLPEQKLHCSVLGEEAIRNAIADYKSKKTI
jgi:NifU-like protein involved in Fe-S cluster formation